MLRSLDVIDDDIPHGAFRAAVGFYESIFVIGIFCRIDPRLLAPIDLLQIPVQVDGNFTEFRRCLRDRSTLISGNQLVGRHEDHRFPEQHHHGSAQRGDWQQHCRDRHQRRS